MIQPQGKTSVLPSAVCPKKKSGSALAEPLFRIPIRHGAIKKFLLAEVTLEHSLEALAVAGFVLKPHFESAHIYCVSAVFLTVDFIISHGFPT